MKHFLLVLALALPVLAGCGAPASNQLPVLGATQPQAVPAKTAPACIGRSSTPDPIRSSRSRKRL